MRPTVWRDAVIDCDELDPTAKLIAVVLGRYMNGGGICWPSRRLIAQRSGKSESTVDRAIRRLEAAGYLVIEWSRGKSSHRYTAALPNVVTHADVEGQPNVVKTEPNVVKTGLQRRQNGPPTSSPMTTEVENPLKAGELVSTRASRAGKSERADARTYEEYNRGS